MEPLPNPLRPALVLDGRLRQSLATVRILGRAGIEVFVADTDRRTPAFASRWCSGRAVLPDFGDDPDAFVDGVIALCEALGSPVIITSHDGAIDALRSRRAEVEQVGSLALASEDALSVAVDKRATLAVGERLGLQVPKGRTVTEISSGPNAIDEVGLPLVIKPVVSWVQSRQGGWRGSPVVAVTRAAAMSQLEQLLDAGAVALVQPWLSGARDAVGLFLADGALWAKFAVRSHRMSPMIGGSSVVRETIAMPADVAEMAEALVRELSLEGYAEVEFRRDRDGRPLLMEVNPRLNAGVEVALRAGVDVPSLLYRRAAGQPLQAALNYRAGQRMRWLEGDLNWLAEAVAHPEHPDAPPRPVRVFLKEFARPAGFDYWDRKDVRPVLRQVTRDARAAIGRITRR